jgi:triosephosphate isomerase (TIM)
MDKPDTGRVPIVGGNWKMNTVLPTAIDLAEALVRGLGEPAGVEVVLFPPFPNLEAVHRVIDGSALQLGAQDVFWEDSGAYTGEVSGPMLRAVGCDWVIVGHSERRHILGESDEIVNRKLHAGLRSKLNVVLAVGETAEERRAGKAFKVVQTQLRKSLAGVEPSAMDRVVVAYEPVWAIGTGDTATPEQVREMHGTVRIVLGALMGGRIAGTARIQYGGSVTAQNAAELMSQPGVDGALVGGASLKPSEFAIIVRAAGR